MISLLAGVEPAASAVPAAGEPMATEAPAATVVPTAEQTGSVTSCGWPDELQRRVLDKAVSLMPDGLRRQLKRHDRALRQGMQSARRSGEQAMHVQGPSAGDGTADRLAVSAARIAALLDSHASMREVAREMGIAAHLVSDLSNPFRNAPADAEAAAFETRFLDYVDRQQSRLRIVLAGYTDPLLDADRVPDFGRALAARSRSYLDDLVGAFRRYDQTGDPGWIDERSVPFGVASLSYSRSVTDTARIWLHAWRRAHGDLSGLPYPLEPPAEPAPAPR